jgi:glycine/D-amino acid oxidase-like deaminating enzyme
LVEPRAFTKGLMRAAETHGAVLRHDTVVVLVRHPGGAVRGVVAQREVVSTTMAAAPGGPRTARSRGKWLSR